MEADHERAYKGRRCVGVRGLIYPHAGEDFNFFPKTVKNYNSTAINFDFSQKYNETFHENFQSNESSSFLIRSTKRLELFSKACEDI